MSWETAVENWASVESHLDDDAPEGEYAASFGSVVIPEDFQSDLIVRMNPEEFGRDFEEVPNVREDTVEATFPWGTLFREDTPGQLIKFGIHQTGKKLNQLLALNEQTMEERYPQWLVDLNFGWDTDHEKIILQGCPGWINGPVRCEIQEDRTWEIKWVGRGPMETIHIWAEDDHFMYDSLDEAMAAIEQTVSKAIEKYEGVVENPEDILPLGGWETAVLSFPSAGLYPASHDEKEDPEVPRAAAQLILQELKEFEFTAV